MSEKRGYDAFTEGIGLYMRTLPGGDRYVEPPKSKRKNQHMPANNINSVTITGNLTRDPEARATSSGRSVCELRIAVNSNFKSGDKWESKPNYFQVNTWGGLADNCAKYLEKGSPIAVSGRLEWQKWESKDGGLNSRVVIVAENVQFLARADGSRKDVNAPKDEATEQAAPEEDSAPDEPAF